MSIVLSNQKDLRRCQGHSFCYLCGKPLGDDKSADHVPPKAIFSSADRTPPLILPAHRTCNSGQSQSDEILGQLIAVLHGQYPDKDKLRLRLSVGQVPGAPVPTGLLHCPDLSNKVWRWISGFHAALYGEYLPVDHAKRQLHLPLPDGNLKEAEVFQNPAHAFRPIITEELKKNRMARQVDAIVCYNRKCEYNCIWVRADGGEWLCMFGLRIYNWEDLGDPNMGPQRGCVGMYQPPIDRCPAGASQGTKLILELPRTNALDPFSV